MKKQKGITLIALVITIIIMLILVAVTVNYGIKSGLLGKAKEGASRYKYNEEEEEIGQILLEYKVDLKTDNIIQDKDLEEYLSYGLKDKAEVKKNGKTISVTYIKTNNIHEVIDENGIERYPRNELKIGDYVEYKSKAENEYPSNKLVDNITGTTYNTKSITRENLKWRILKIYDNGDVKLIANPTTDKVYFRGATGQNNGVFIMNDICEKLYSDNDHNIKARSVNLIDLEEELTEGGINARNSNYDNVYYGEQKKYTSYKDYPAIYQYENGIGIDVDTIKTDGINESESFYNEETMIKSKNKGVAYFTATKSLKVTRTFYWVSIDNKNFGDLYEILKSDITYWLATRSVSVCQDPRFGLRTASTAVSGVDMYALCGYVNDYGNVLRPVVTIKSNIEIVKSEGDISNPHQINFN